MLYPQNNRARTVIDLSGVWDFRLTEDAPWEPLAVPGSYNDQKPDSRYREHCGLSWYRRRIALPAALHEGRQVLRFDAVTHSARVFLDGVLVEGTKHFMSSTEDDGSEKPERWLKGTFKDGTLYQGEITLYADGEKTTYSVKDGKVQNAV